MSNYAYGALLPLDENRGHLFSSEELAEIQFGPLLEKKFGQKIRVIHCGVIEKPGGWPKGIKTDVRMLLLTRTPNRKHRFVFIDESKSEPKITKDFPWDPRMVVVRPDNKFTLQTSLGKANSDDYELTCKTSSPNEWQDACVNAGLTSVSDWASKAINNQEPPERPAKKPKAARNNQERLDQLSEKPGNEFCVEKGCLKKSEYASVTYGTFICKYCAGKHRHLGVHLSFVQSLALDDLFWNAKKNDQYLQQMTQGGNDKMKAYWEEHKQLQKLSFDELYGLGETTPPEIMDKYREDLEKAALLRRRMLEH